MITVKPHGKQGYYRNSKGKEKTVVMWAEEGTKERRLRSGKTLFSAHPSRGRMPAYHFLNAAEARGTAIVESQLTTEIEDAATKRLRASGWQ